MSRDGWLPPGVTDADIDRAERLKASNAELLEALQECADAIYRNQDADDQLILDKARAVIAKATGKT